MNLNKTKSIIVCSLLFVLLPMLTNAQSLIANQCNAFKFKEFERIRRKLCSLSTNNHTIGLSCPFPTDKQIENAISKYNNIFSVAYFLNVPEFQEKFSHIPLRTYKWASINETIGEISCNIKNKTQPHVAGVCPYHFVLQYRPDVIPNFRKQAICNCPRCHEVVKHNVKDNEHRCTQIIKVAPILELGKCIRDGNKVAEYELNLAFEEVSIACECMLSPDLQRHRK